MYLFKTYSRLHIVFQALPDYLNLLGCGYGNTLALRFTDSEFSVHMTRQKYRYPQKSKKKRESSRITADGPYKDSCLSIHTKV